MQWQFPIAMAVYVQLPEGITEYPQFCCFIPSQPREVSIHPASYDHGEDHGGDLCCALTATAKIKQITCVLPGN